MNRARPSIFHPMRLVILAGLGFSALRIGSFDDFRAIYTTTVVLLLGSIVASRYRPGPEGGFWFGFAVFGWGYLLIAIAPWTWWGQYPGGQSTWKYHQPLDSPLIWTQGIADGTVQAWAGPLPAALSGGHLLGRGAVGLTGSVGQPQASARPHPGDRPHDPGLALGRDRRPAGLVARGRTTRPDEARNHPTQMTPNNRTFHQG